MAAKAKAFEQKAKGPAENQPVSTKKDDGTPSAVGMKAKFEKLANPDPPKATPGKVAWSEDRDQGRKKVHQPGFDPTKPPPPRSITDLP